LIDLINGKKVADPLYTGLDECVPSNIDVCHAKVFRFTHRFDRREES